MCEKSTISNFIVPDQVVNNRESGEFFWSTLIKTRHVMSGGRGVRVCVYVHLSVHCLLFL